MTQHMVPPWRAVCGVRRAGRRALVRRLFALVVSFAAVAACEAPESTDPVDSPPARIEAGARAATGTGTGTGTATASETKLPNIVLIISDDHGYPYFGFMGSEIVRTPHLDRLAEEGFLFTQGFSTSNSCRPALFTLLTGLHPAQRPKGVVMQAIMRFSTLPRLLGKVGYRSLQTGKHWEGSPEEAGFSQGTKTRPEKGVLGVEQLRANAGGPGLEVGRSTMKPVWDFIDGNDPDTPFFLWFAPYLPHRPHDPTPEQIAAYDGYGLFKSTKLYFANVTRLDSAVGDLLAGLEERGLTEETLVVFVSDNGWHQPDEHFKWRDGPHGKNSLYEYAFRTPVLFSWPGHVPTGVDTTSLVSIADIYPTILAFAGVTPPPRHARDLRPLFSGASPDGFDRVIGGVRTVRVPPEEMTSGKDWFREEEAYYLRTREWRYLWFVEQEREELYRIDIDPEEEKDLASERPDLVRQFRKEVETWRREIVS